MRYHLFVSEHYYPNGGLWDYRGSFDTLTEAEAAGEERQTTNNSVHIIVQNAEGNLEEIAP